MKRKTLLLGMSLPAIALIACLGNTSCHGVGTIHFHGTEVSSTPSPTVTVTQPVPVPDPGPTVTAHATATITATTMATQTVTASPSPTGTASTPPALPTPATPTPCVLDIRERVTLTAFHLHITDTCGLPILARVRCSTGEWEEGEGVLSCTSGIKIWGYDVDNTFYQLGAR